MLTFESGWCDQSADRCDSGADLWDISSIFELFFAYLIIQEFADLWQLHLSSSKWGLSKRFFARQHPASRFIPLLKSSDDTIADQHPLSLIIFSILDYTWYLKIIWNQGYDTTHIFTTLYSHKWSSLFDYLTHMTLNKNPLILQGTLEAALEELEVG